MANPLSRKLAGPNGVTVEFVKVTPKLADRWLGKNTRNRNVRKLKVAAFTRDMREGRWRLNGAAIAFDVEGRLADGQHRLLACIESGVSFSSLIVRGLEPAAQDTIDIGAARTPGDQLTIHGEKDTRTLAAVIRNAVRLLEGRTAFSGTGDITSPKILGEFDKDREGYRAAAAMGRRVAKTLPVAPGIMGAAYYACSVFESDADADLFFGEQLAEGIGLQAGDPVLALRARFARAEHDGRRMHPTDQMRYTLLAWRAFREGRKLTKLQAPRGGWTARNFPSLGA